jgi:hypothetical protein
MSKHKGGCHCGAVKFWTDLDPMIVNQCNCNRCRKLYGTVNCAAFYHEAEVTFDGTMASYEFTGGSGMPVKSHFCVNCGTRVFGEAEAFPELVFIMIGAFENSRLFKPRFEIFNNYRLDWLTHNGSIEESFDEHAVEERIGAMLESLNDR